ncbi:hypothetical protein EV363DRAFT_1398284 [Boletus edulis]|uniref:Secreted protein n=1 Tax=Boletus edulis BED1 TaxID=1328754 RepID=A0AAD4GAM3_BOLED|nr:hypothetical protein EV363DRAFT_1398284 [Boletus edulis]KAF8434317.1 hypothetical protein L210DRAFT_419274 [Boletus edulis BED1]
MTASWSLLLQLLCEWYLTRQAEVCTHASPDSAHRRRYTRRLWRLDQQIAYENPLSFMILVCQKWKMAIRTQ